MTERGSIMAEMVLKAERPGLTRDRLVSFLLKQPSTIAVLARELGVTPNAVRAQIALLEREGIVEVQGSLKGERRPSSVYGIRAGAEVRPSRAYPALVSAMVRVLSQKMPDREFSALMQGAGKQIAEGAPKNAGGTPRERVEAALTFLRSLGSDAEMTVAKGKIVLTGRVCPIARAVQTDERSCLAMESLLKELTGLPVTERCDHQGPRPGCRFEFKLPGSRS